MASQHVNPIIPNSLAGANFSSFDFQSIFDIPNGVLNVNLSPTVWIGTGYNNVQGAKWTITKVGGNISYIIPNPTSNQFDLTPPNMQAGVVSFTLPTAFSGVEWGIFQLQCVLTDQDGTQYTQSKNFNLCQPNQCTPQTQNTSNACMSLFLDIQLKNGTGYAYDQTIYAYQQVTATAFNYSNAIYFPAPAQIAPITTNQPPPLQFSLISGVTTTYSASNIVTYNFDNYIVVYLKYVGQTNKDVPTLNLSAIYCCLVTLEREKQLVAGTPLAVSIQGIQNEVWSYINYIEVGARYNYDVTQWITAIKNLLPNCNCTSDCVAVTPMLQNQTTIVNVVGAGSVTVTPSLINDVQTYTVSGTIYQIVYGGSLLVPELNISSQQNGNVVTTKLSVNFSVLLAYIQANIEGLGNNVIYNNTSGSGLTCSTGTAYQALMDFTLPAATGTGVPLLTLSNDGDSLDIEAMINTTPGHDSVTKTLQVQFGGSAVASIPITAGSNSLLFKINLTRISASVQLATYVIFEELFPSSSTTVQSFLPVSFTKDLTTNNDITVGVTNSISTAGAATAYKLQVTLNKFQQ